MNMLLRIYLAIPMSSAITVQRFLEFYGTELPKPLLLLFYMLINSAQSDVNICEVAS